MINDKDACYLFVYFKQGRYGTYKTTFHMAKWSIAEYKKWFNEKGKKKDMLIQFGDSDLFDHGFFLVSEVAGMSLGIIDKEQLAIDAAMRKKQLEVLGKSDRMLDDFSKGDEWKGT